MKRTRILTSGYMGVGCILLQKAVQLNEYKKNKYKPLVKVNFNVVNLFKLKDLVMLCAHVNSFT